MESPFIMGFSSVSFIRPLCLAVVVVYGGVGGRNTEVIER